MVRQLCVDSPRHQGVTPDLVLPQRDGHGLHHGEDGGFGGGVVGLEAAAEEGADGGDADNGAAVALLDHLVGGCLAGVEGSFDVDVDAVVEEIRFDPI